MKKFLKFMLVLIIIVGGLATYVFLANGKMMWHVVKADKAELANDLTKSISKVHDYGNFNFSYSSGVEQKDKDGKIILKNNVSSELKIKFDGEMTYLSATTTQTDKDGNKTTTNYFAERTSEGITTLYSDDGTSKKKAIVLWDAAIAKALGASDISYSLILKIVNESDYEFPKDDLDNLDKATVAFSFSPFYVGSKILLNYDTGVLSSDVEYNIDLRGNFRKYSMKGNAIGVGSTSTMTENFVVNKPGKSVEINKLTDEQKTEYSLLG